MLVVVITRNLYIKKRERMEKEKKNIGAKKQRRQKRGVWAKVVHDTTGGKKKEENVCPTRDGQRFDDGGGKG